MFISRQTFETEELNRLAPYAMFSKHSLGRTYPEMEHSYRTAYQRDRDRIIHTTAFRRLEHKTQVFLTNEGDYYRTRLTHTLEVAQIGRTIARALRVNEDLTEAICLAHDLGHSPFGHSGEAALNELMENVGGFDHNFQSFRIIEKLEERYPDFRGLNLTWEVKEGILKHETEYDRSNVLDDFEPDLRPTLEAQIVNLADEIAYTTADLDDGLRSGLITPKQLAALSLWQSITQELNIDPTGELSTMDRHRFIRRLVGKQVDDLIQASSEALAAQPIETVQDIRRLPTNIIAHSPEMAQQNRALKDFLLTHLYHHWRVLRMDLKARRLITELFQLYVSTPAILSAELQARIKQQGLRRMVCDYIAGMTDRFAIQEHNKLFNPLERV